MMHFWIANALLSRVYESYLNVVSESEVLTEADREWAGSKRVETIKHVAGVDL
jgi:pyridoxal biosynthesis lyase PdxS